ERPIRDARWGAGSARRVLSPRPREAPAAPAWQSRKYWRIRPARLVSLVLRGALESVELLRARRRRRLRGHRKAHCGGVSQPGSFASRVRERTTALPRGHARAGPGSRPSLYLLEFVATLSVAGRSARASGSRDGAQGRLSHRQGM